jgi:hypothetical protein
VSKELCWDLAGKFARESGTKTGDAIEPIDTTTKRSQVSLVLPVIQKPTGSFIR